MKYLAYLQCGSASQTHLSKYRSAYTCLQLQNRLCPQLKWEAVDGASEYVIYMVDMNANGFIHWKSKGITDTELPQGWASSSDYVGPWPAPGFTHIYEIYVVALRKLVDRLKGGLNAGNPKFEEFITGLDSDSEGKPGNVLAYGKISGKFTG